MDVTYQIIIAQCVYFCHHHIGWDMFSLKYHSPSNTNRVDSFVVEVNRKISPFFTPNGIKVQGVHYRYKGYFTYGIRASYNIIPLRMG